MGSDHSATLAAIEGGTGPHRLDPLRQRSSTTGIAALLQAISNHQSATYLEGSVIRTIVS